MKRIHVGFFARLSIPGLLLTALTGYALAASPQSNVSNPVDFHIKPQALPSALLQFSDQAHIQVVSRGEEVAKRHTVGVTGRMNVPSALRRLLSGTGLTYTVTGGNTIAVRAAGKAGVTGSASSPAALSTRESGGDAPPIDPPAPATSTQTSETKLSNILVTGSLIKRSTAVTSQPVLTITRQQLKATGMVSIGDVLQQLTAVAPTQNAAFNFEGNGASNVDLRYLGPKRVLVLVNGKRWATNLNGETNLNSIPVSVVKRIEVLKDGASAIYGTDAIAGVINIITIKDFKGAEVSAYRGIYRGDGHWDGLTQDYTATLGSFDSNSSWVVNAEYRKNNRIPAVDRTFSAEPVAGTGVTRASSATPQGRFLFVAPTNDNPSNPNVSPAPYTGLTSQQCPAKNFGTSTNPEYLPYCDLTLLPGTNGANPANYVPFTNADRYNWIKPSGASRGDSLLIPVTEKSVYFAGNYQFDNGITATTSLMYDEGAARTDSAPDLLPLNSGTIPANSPYNPFGFTLSTSQPIQVAPGVQRPTLSAVYRRLSEFPARYREYTRKTFRYMGGLNGMFTSGSTIWNWSASFLYLDASLLETQYGLVNGQHLSAAFDPAVCAKTDGCVPVNLFGGQGTNGQGTITPGMINFLEYNNTNYQSQTERIYNAAITTSTLANLPGGGLGFAAGYQLRQLEGGFTPDSVAAQPSILGPATLPTSGGYKVNAVYSEVHVPILRQLPWAYHLDVDVATRYSRYSTFGSKLRSRAGIKWQPISDLALRGTWSEGFRAPNINEAFGGQRTSFPTVFDPCSNYTNSGVSQAVQKRCEAAGVPPSYTQTDQQINARNGGNPNLNPETSISKTVGFIYSPSAVPHLSFGATYYHIEIDNTIQPYGAQNVINACFLTGNQTYCPDIKRNALGEPTQILNLEQNVGSTVTSGIDFDVGYHFTTSVGRFDTQLTTTHVRAFRTITPTGSGSSSVLNYVGRELAGSNQPLSVPSWKANLRIGWNLGHWQARWMIHYISSLREKCSDYLDNTPESLANLGLCSDPNYQNNALSTNRMASVVWHDIQLTYSASNNIDYTIGINNVLNKKPPQETQPIEDMAFDPTEYEALIGRYIYGSITAHF